jgi:hypothetical protein
MQSVNTTRPSVWLVGEIEHPDFAETVALVRDAASVGSLPPELIVMAQSRPGVFSAQWIERLRRSAPLAGVVALLGTWCEGETRSGRPAPGVLRLYWHEFPNWWRRQLALRAMGRCPEWARLDDFGFGIADCGLDLRNARIAIDTVRFDTAAAIEDVLQSAGAEAIWVRPGRSCDLSGVTAGIWEGGQLDNGEVERLAAFCTRLAPHHAPVLALLDFPRLDRCEVARHAGAAAVMGKPWWNVDLVGTIRHLSQGETAATHSQPSRAA